MCVWGGGNIIMFPLFVKWLHLHLFFGMIIRLISHLHSKNGIVCNWNECDNWDIIFMDSSLSSSRLPFLYFRFDTFWIQFNGRWASLTVSSLQCTRQSSLSLSLSSDPCQRCRFGLTGPQYITAPTPRNIFFPDTTTSSHTMDVHATWWTALHAPNREPISCHPCWLHSWPRPSGRHVQILCLTELKCFLEDGCVATQLTSRCQITGIIRCPLSKSLTCMRSASLLLTPVR